MTSNPKPSSGAERSNLRFLRNACLALIGGLFVLSVPWYRESEEPLVLWFGLPDWVAVALLCYVGVAVLNGIAWLATDIPDVLPIEEGADQEGAGQ